MGKKKGAVKVKKKKLGMVRPVQCSLYHLVLGKGKEKKTHSLKRIIFLFAATA